MPPTPTELRHRAAGDTLESLPVIELNDSNKSTDNGKEQKLVGVDGNWYDVTNFLKHHPGGPVIEQFIGQDATHVFHAYGHEGVLKHRKPVGTYKMPIRHPADADFEKLIQFAKEKGYFETDFVWYLKKMFVAFMLLAVAFYLVIGFEQWYVHYLGAVALAFHWQQCGFIMHDFMHSQVFRKHSKDGPCGTIFGAVFFGISASWWRDEHIIHHAMTNVVNVAQRFVDPQMWESAWAQNEKLFPLFRNTLQYCFVKIQHITFIPIVVFIGRYEIVTDSFRQERRWPEWVGACIHWMWICFLLSHLPTWKEVFTFYVIAASVEGIFHFQLILSHYCKAFYTTDEFHKYSWFEYQVLSNMNIETWWFLDWYYGGLNYHIEHHLFPTMARKHLRSIGPYVEEVCKKHGIDYDMCPFAEAMWKTLVHLKKTGNHFTLDPR
ncbi:sphingolipid 10-desaturase [Lingula anatina]|uniref:Sphingolipid 10-desaturase n=1 Tax=Lingula anatina TaxID=7574 RepID=A0A1S3IMS5_LINAN|nr:sphingolipid 10-desaturase [Lingula anatina]XP_013399509.1 sphingolipid 10-desaturase [Lingula anatina]XP_013399517.1 sphingolipid 10-desaturase [Lingula anatina]|eukprot:XP_013399502.1 sphingolipid 10-desaturase [Lingula anatina]